MGSTGPVLHRLLIFLSVGPSAAGSELSRLYIYKNQNTIYLNQANTDVYIHKESQICIAAK